MFYFFEKGRQSLQCEVRNTDLPDTFAIVLTEPNGKVRTQYITGSKEVQRRWTELESDLAKAGWWGPLGRD